MRRTEDGLEEFIGHGIVTNRGSEQIEIPDILVVMLDGSDEEVFRQEVAPSQRLIGPGQVLPIDFTLSGIPAAARYADIGWLP